MQVAHQAVRRMAHQAGKDVSQAPALAGAAPNAARCRYAAQDHRGVVAAGQAAHPDERVTDAANGVEAAHTASQLAPHRREEAMRRTAERASQVCRSGHDAFCRSRGRRRASIGGKIRDGEVNLVTDARDHRQCAGLIARATCSSLNAHRSSSDPPPRARISTSHSPRLEASSMRRMMPGAAAAPCTGVG